MARKCGVVQSMCITAWGVCACPAYSDVPSEQPTSASAPHGATAVDAHGDDLVPPQHGVEVGDDDHSASEESEGDDDMVHSEWRQDLLVNTNRMNAPAFIPSDDEDSDEDE